MNKQELKQHAELIVKELTRTELEERYLELYEKYSDMRAQKDELLPIVSNSLFELNGKTIPVTFHVSKFEPKGLIKHVNGTLRTVIKTNKEDAKYWQEWNLMCLKHCIGQLEKL